ncbi:hypothetical protein F0562_006485 [Nyssa sinensis]|uniref:OBG-type G domain-containing protein n=1 Tax=Nyssa sinensis TaxID=561372 RepID=A0A5J5ANK2_9ASTE|nr:hypothetical protein F0562_006485 [Nyssa sinensis]
MRKVKYTQQNYHEKLSTIIEEFTWLEDIHPFYGDLLPVLYNRDNYKLALGQINTARNLIDYKCLRYQVIDTPGILDRPFEDRNIIEMCSITALAHLRAAVLFFLDISGSCGYSIAQQVALFHRIKSLFMNTPLIIVCNKTDLQLLDGISEEDMKLVEEMNAEATKTVISQGGELTGDEGVL